MFESLMLPVLLQGITVPDEFYVVEISDEAISIFEQSDPENPDSSVAALEELAEQGDDSALQALGELHGTGGLGIQRDAARACDYYEQLNGRRPDGLHNQATCYFEGVGRAQDLSRARQIYRRAAEAGYLQSMCAYGNMLVRGQGGPTNAEEGLRLCRSDAVAGDANAQTDYGIYLLEGAVVERDPVTARFMFEQAGQQKQRNAAFLLGQMHTKGDATPANIELAAEWFAKAFEYGRADAAYQAAMSFTRLGFRQEGEQMLIKPDLLRTAIEWFEIAAERDPDGDRRTVSVTMIDNLRVLLDRAG